MAKLPNDKCYQADTLRRTVIKFGLGAGMLLTGGACSKAQTQGNSHWTPRQTEGPFYPVQQQADKDVDLTMIDGHSERAKGQVIRVQGRVLDTNGEILTNAFVEIWQANSEGKYRHPRDPNNAPIDPNFQGWGQTNTSAQGRYGFKTIKPGAYPAGPDWTRPPHIHFKAAKDGFASLTTQMYFPDEQLNNIDRILQSLTEPEQRVVIAKRQTGDAGEPVFHFDIVLRRIK
jgi:protocatechuate 3,4-dioxygenase beta subunit